jgi:hypothetical protein
MKMTQLQVSKIVSTANRDIYLTRLLDQLSYRNTRRLFGHAPSALVLAIGHAEKRRERCYQTRAPKSGANSYVGFPTSQRAWILEISAKVRWDYLSSEQPIAINKTTTMSKVPIIMIQKTIRARAKQWDTPS